MNALKSLLYDIIAVALIIFNIIFVVLTFFYFERFLLLLLSLIIMCTFILFRKIQDKKWEKELEDTNYIPTIYMKYLKSPEEYTK